MAHVKPDAVAENVIEPAGFVVIVMLGLEFVAGNFAPLPVAAADGKPSGRARLSPLL